MEESSIVLYVCRYKNTTQFQARLILITWAYYFRVAGSAFPIWSGGPKESHEICHPSQY